MEVVTGSVPGLSHLSPLASCCNLGSPLALESGSSRERGEEHASGLLLKPPDITSTHNRGVSVCMCVRPGPCQ